MEKMHDRNWNFGAEELLYSYMGGGYKNTPEDIARIAYEKSVLEAPVVAGMIKLQADDTVLDIGSGYGHIASALAPQAKSYICADISSEMLKHCRANTSNISNIEYFVIDRFDLSLLTERKINKAFSNSVFIHLNLFDIAIYLKQVASLLEDGGLFYFNFQNAEILALESDPNFFDMMMRYYRDPQEITLMQWNSMTAIRAIALTAGFRLRETRQWIHCATLAVFEKASA